MEIKSKNKNSKNKSLMNEAFIFMYNANSLDSNARQKDNKVK